MQYIIFILLGLFIVHLVIRLRKKEMQLLELQTKLYQMQTETEQADRTAEEATAIKDEIRDHINTIHLYASLSEEESHSASVKEKQKDIIRLSEIILHQIYKYRIQKRCGTKPHRFFCWVMSSRKKGASRGIL